MLVLSVEVVCYILFGCNDGHVTSVNGSGTSVDPHLLENPCTTALTWLPEEIVINFIASFSTIGVQALGTTTEAAEIPTPY